RVREGAPARPLPERARPADDTAPPARGRHVRAYRLGHRDPRGGCAPRRGARRARGRRHLLLRGRRAGEPPARRVLHGDPAGARRAMAGEFWVAERVLGAFTRAEFERCDVALFLGKNPWHSHSIPRARVTLKEIARDPARTLIVVDPRRTETAEIADIHLPVRPGMDAFLLAAILGVLVTEGLYDRAFLDAHAVDC